MDFSDLFCNEKSGGPGPQRVDRAAWLGSTVDRGGADKTMQWCLAGTWCIGARARQCPPVMVEEDEPNEAVPEGCSPEHEQWWRGGAAEVKNGGGLSST
jgi:hypothetical protein